MSSMTHVYNSQEVILRMICNVSSVCLSLRESFMCCAAVELQSTGYRKLPLALPNRNVKLHKGNKSFFPTQQHTQNLSTKKKKKKIYDSQTSGSFSLWKGWLEVYVNIPCRFFFSWLLPPRALITLPSVQFWKISISDSFAEGGYGPRPLLTSIHDSRGGTRDTAKIGFKNACRLLLNPAVWLLVCI